ELERHEQDPQARVASGDELTVYKLDRTHVEATRRLRGEEHTRLPADLPREDDLLLIPSRERRRRCLRAAAAHVEALEKPSRARDERAREEPAMARVRRFLVVVEREVLREREVE